MLPLFSNQQVVRHRVGEMRIMLYLSVSGEMTNILSSINGHLKGFGKILSKLIITCFHKLYFLFSCAISTTAHGRWYSLFLVLQRKNWSLNKSSMLRIDIGPQRIIFDSRAILQLFHVVSLLAQYPSRAQCGGSHQHSQHVGGLLWAKGDPGLHSEF